MQTDAKAPISAAGYGEATATKPPDWHGFIVWDMLFNSLSMGLFLAAAVSELAAPETCASVARLAYPVALCFLLIDLVCLVLDLGDPWRFHHMLRVFKPTSPMSLGTWSLTAYSLPLTGIVLLDWVTGPDTLRWLHCLLVVVGLLPALAAVAYKGVLFSTTSQPGWRDARWLGGYHTSTSLVLGGAVLLAIAVLLENEEATELLRAAVKILLGVSVIPFLLLAVDLYPALARVQAFGIWVGVVGMALVFGVAVPQGMLWPDSDGLYLWGVVLILAANWLVRWALVQTPHFIVERAKNGTRRVPTTH